jgi:hypothetical protein
MTAPDPSEAERKAYALLGRAADPLRGFVLLCRHNSDYGNADVKERLTPFHSVSEPPIALATYIARVMKHTECGEDGVLLGLRLAVRYCTKTKMLPSALCAHRLLLVAVVLAVKTHYDKFRSNRTAAKSGGLRVNELNLLEMAMFRGLRYSSVIFQVEVDNLVEGTGDALRDLQSESPSGLPSPAKGGPALPDRILNQLRNCMNGIISDAPEMPDTSVMIEEFVANCSQLASDQRDTARQALDDRTSAPRLSEGRLAQVAGGAGMFAVRSRLAELQTDDAHSVASSAVHSTTSQQAAARRFHTRVVDVWGGPGETTSRTSEGAQSRDSEEVRPAPAPPSDGASNGSRGRAVSAK